MGLRVVGSSAQTFFHGTHVTQRHESLCRTRAPSAAAQLAFVNVCFDPSFFSAQTGALTYEQARAASAR